MHPTHDPAPDSFALASTNGIVPDAESLGELMRAHWPRLVAYAVRLLGDTASAEDIVQRAFVRLWERGHAIPVGDATRPFLYRVVRNLAANEHRRLATQRRWIDDESLSPPAVECPDQVFEGRDLEAALALAVERLPARRREIFVLSRYHGLANADIADVLGVSPQTVANQLVNALRDLRAMLGARLGDAAYPPLKIVRGSESPAG
jgi:RNA polymerase sigma-70 factor (ECF subfamily)